MSRWRAHAILSSDPELTCTLSTVHPPIHGCCCCCCCTETSGRPARVPAPPAAHCHFAHRHTATARLSRYFPRRAIAQSLHGTVRSQPARPPFICCAPAPQFALGPRVHFLIQSNRSTPKMHIHTYKSTSMCNSLSSGYARSPNARDQSTGIRLICAPSTRCLHSSSGGISSSM